MQYCLKVNQSGPGGRASPGPEEERGVIDKMMASVDSHDCVRHVFVCVACVRCCLLVLCSLSKYSSYYVTNNSVLSLNLA